MTRTFVTATWIALVGFVAGISFFVWTIVSSSNLNTCIVCKRHIHPETKTIAQVDGEKTALCCPTCARVLRDHHGRVVTVTEVTDLSTGKLIDARTAYVVVGSDVNHCMREDAHVDATKQPIPKTFDRCSPSMISFLELPAAQQFQSEHGGDVMAGDLALAFERK